LLAIEKMKKNKKDLIIEAAAVVFSQKGFAGTVMAEIAARAGIGKGTIYEYFKSKEDLFFAVFEWYARKSSTSATVSISALSGSVSERLEALNESIMNSWGELRDVFSLVFEFWAASVSSQMRQKFKDEFRKAYEDYRRIVSSLIRDGIERGEFRFDIDPESVAAALVGTWDALLLQAWFEDTFDPMTTAKKYITVLIRGLVATETTEK